MTIDMGLNRKCLKCHKRLCDCVERISPTEWKSADQEKIQKLETDLDAALIELEIVKTLSNKLSSDYKILEERIEAVEVVPHA